MKDFVLPSKPHLAREYIKINVDRSTLFVCNHSGGKDSQAMFKWMYDNLPHDQIVVVHAELPGADWEGTIDHIHLTTHDIPVYVVRANKTFMEMVDHRGMFPSVSFRQCTSDLKRSPIAKFIRNYSRKHGYSRVVNCIGLRAEESHTRNKKSVLGLDKSLTISTREVITFYPILDYKLRDVYASYNVSIADLFKRRQLYNMGLIEEALQDFPFIYTYVAGMSRHSCKLCIMSSDEDLCVSAKLDPDNFKVYNAMERKLDFTFIMPSKGRRRFLNEIVAAHNQKSLQASLF